MVLRHRAQLLRRPAATTARNSAWRVAVVLEVVRQVGVEGDAVARARGRGARRRSRAPSAPPSTTAVSRLPGSCSGGSPAPPGRRARARACAARRRRAGRAAAASAPRRGARRGCACAARAARMTTTWPPSSRRRSCESVSSRPAAILLGDRERRAGLAALDLREHRRRDAAALGQVAQREVHRLAQRPDPRAHGGSHRVVDRRHRRLYVITDACMSSCASVPSSTPSKRAGPQNPSGVAELDRPDLPALAPQTLAAEAEALEQADEAAFVADACRPRAVQAELLERASPRRAAEPRRA